MAGSPAGTPNPDKAPAIISRRANPSNHSTGIPNSPQYAPASCPQTAPVVSYVAPLAAAMVNTADDLEVPCAYPFEPAVDEARRAVLRAELDAWFARAYGLTRDELRYILDPADVYGPDFPSETFRVLKQKEQAKFGEYRTRRLVLEAWDRLSSVPNSSPSSISRVGPQ